MKYVLELETVFPGRDDVKIISDIFNPKFVVEASSAEEAKDKLFEALTLAWEPTLADDEEIKSFHKVQKIEAGVSEG